MAGEVRYYTVEEAARVLRLTPEHIVEMIEAGELEGIPRVGGAGWMIPIRGDVIVPPPVPEVPVEPLTSHNEVRELPEEHGEPILPPEQAIEDVETPRQSAEPPRGEAAASNREPTSQSGWVTTQQAARALGISARTVRWHIERGNLQAKPEGEGVERTWRVSVDSLHAFRDSRQRQRQSPRNHRASANASETAAEGAGSAIRELADRLVEEARRAEAARVRLELAERAQSTLEAELVEERRRREVAEREREDAQRERDERRRALEELAEARRRQEEMERERDELRRELEALKESHEEAPGSPESPAPSDTPTEAAGEAQGATERPEARSWWRRMFGA